MKSSQLVAVVLILLGAFGLINWVRDGGWSIVQCLPFVGGSRPSALYDGAGLFLLFLLARSLYRLSRSSEDGGATADYSDDDHDYAWVEDGAADEEDSNASAT